MVPLLVLSGVVAARPATALDIPGPDMPFWLWRTGAGIRTSLVCTISSIWESSVEVVLRGKTYKLYGRVGLMVAWLTQNQGRLNDISPLQLTFHSGGPKSKTVTAKLLQEDEVGEEILDKGC